MSAFDDLRYEASMALMGVDTTRRHLPRAEGPAMPTPPAEDLDTPTEIEAQWEVDD